jgi:hypothetical protein
MEANVMFDSYLVWAYVDPVTVLPVTSIIATVLGVFVLCGKNVLSSVGRWVGLAKFSRVSRPAPQGTHFSMRRYGSGERMPDFAQESGARRAERA